MSVQFLTQEYVDAAAAALGTHVGFGSAINGVDLAMQFNVIDAPDGGDINYYVDIADGGAEVGLGELEEPDITIINDYETAAGISQGEINTQMAFMTGKLKVSGDMSKLMLNIGVVNAMMDAMSQLDVAY